MCRHIRASKACFAGLRDPSGGPGLRRHGLRGGALRGLRWTSYISRQVTSAGRSIYTNFPAVTYRVSGLYSCSAAVKPAKIMQKIAGSNLVCTIFEPRSLLVHTSTYLHILVQHSTYQYVLLICAYIYYLVCTGTCRYIPVYTGIYWYILVYTSMYCAFRHMDFFEIR